jgi:hypothetical protein
MGGDQLKEALTAWRHAVASRARSQHGDHAWGNAEMAVRFWRAEVRDANTQRRRRLPDAELK